MAVRLFQAGSIVAALLALLIAPPACGQERDRVSALEAAAKRLQDATVTIRISCKKEQQARSEREEPKREAEGDHASQDKDCKRPCSVVVCSGVCVAANRVVTAVPVSSDSIIRLTFPGGTQDDARLRVVDEFSGLVLLDSPKCAAQPLEMADALPEAGSTAVTASAWGVEKPLVFQGMVSGTGHTLTGICYPPLLVCQLPTTDTSSGAAVVDREGKLLGIVVGADPAAAQRHWMTYAVPASHVQRLVRACEESDKDRTKDSIVVLKRRRPLVGWKLESEGDEIVVERIIAEGPAAKAGVKKGDRVLAVDGIQIRSIYQAWAPTMCKQAGDTLTYRIRRDDQTLDVVVVLGGAVEVDSLPAERLSEIVQPKLEFGRDEKGDYYFKPFRSSSSAGERPASESQRIELLEAENRRLKAELDKLQKDSAARRVKSP